MKILQEKINKIDNLNNELLEIAGFIKIAENKEPTYIKINIEYSDPTYADSNSIANRKEVRSLISVMLPELKKLFEEKKEELNNLIK